MTEHETNTPEPWSWRAPVDPAAESAARAAGESAAGPAGEPVTGPDGSPSRSSDEPTTDAGPSPWAPPSEAPAGPWAPPPGAPPPDAPRDPGSWVPPSSDAGRSWEGGSWESGPPTAPVTGPPPGYPHGAAQPGMPGPPPGYPPPPTTGFPGPGYPGPGYPGQPAPGAPPRRSGRKGLLALAAVGLMGVAALGGGVAGAAIYAVQSDDTGSGTDATRVVDAPQLDYTSLASIASQVSPSVVSIEAGQAGGSGVVMSADGLILTNAHVVEAGGSNEVTVNFSTGDKVSGTVVGADTRSDIAVIQVEGASDLTPATFADSSEVLVGDTVLAMGSPLNLEGSVTQGIISGLDRTLSPDGSGYSLSGLLQSDAAINPGNSGGALVNMAGEVVGINTAIATSGQSNGFIGVGFAVPSNRATDVAQQIIDGEEVQHPFLGVRVGTSPEGGAVIGEVTPGSPADEAGIEEGDVVVRFGDRQISDDSDLVSAVQAADVGQTVEVEFQRDGSTQTTSVTLAAAGD